MSDAQFGLSLEVCPWNLVHFNQFRVLLTATHSCVVVLCWAPPEKSVLSLSDHTAEEVAVVDKVSRYQNAAEVNAVQGAKYV